MKYTLSVVVLAAASVAAHAQYVVVPGAYANTAASSSGFNLPLNSGGRTGQAIINANQLGDIAVGSQITGISFRLYTGASQNFGGATWNDYRISVGESVAPLSASSTFSTNFLSGATLVRSGALTLAANSFTRGANPNPWGVEITFDTPYTYTGGHLAIQINHGASSASIPSGTNLLEIARADNAGYVAGNFRYLAGSGGTANDLTGSNDGFFVSRLSVMAPVPEPATCAALGLGALALLRRRRKA